MPAKHVIDPPSREALGPAFPLAQATAFVLAKQGLAGSGCASVYDATLATAGVYSTAPTCYLSYAARVDGFRLAHLDEELYQRRRLVRLRCMRQSAYIEPVAALPAIVAATGPGEKAFVRLVRLSGLTDESYATLADRIEAVMAGQPPVTVPEIRALLGADAPTGRDALRYVVALMCRQTRLVRSEVRGSWRSDSFAYARWSDWVGDPVPTIDPASARADLARSYLRAFGPASAADLKWWAGWNTRDTTAAIAALGDTVSPVTLTSPDGKVVSALALADELPALAAARAEAARDVRLLPVWDAYLMGYTDRRRLVADSDYPRVYDRAGNSTSVVLADGIAAGVWEFEQVSDTTDAPLTIRVAPFGVTAVDRWAEVEEAAARVAAAIGSTDVRVERAAPPGALTDGVRNAFLAPIRLGKSG